MTDEECLALFKSLKSALDAGDASKFNSHIDWVAMLNRATANLGTEQDREQIKSGALTSLTSQNAFGNELVKNVKGGGSFDLLRLKNQRGRRTALVRFLLAGGALNYFELELVREPDRQIKIVDIYPFAAGELMSQTLRRGFIPVVARTSQTLIEKLTKGEGDYLKSLNEILEMTKALSTDRPQDALAIYGKLPPSVQKDKTVLMVRLRAALAVNEAEYAAAIEAIRTNFPQDPALDLIALDGYFMKKQYAEALAGIDRLDKSVGGDPYLNVLRANTYVEQGDLNKARDFAEQGVAGAPQVLATHWALVTLTLRQEDYAATLAELKNIRRNFRLQFGDMTKVREYAGFCKSPQYQEWLEFLKDAGKNAAPAAPSEKKAAAPQ